MIQRIQLVHVFLITFLLVSSSVAWPWPPSMENIEALILRRADAKSSSDSSPTSDKSDTANSDSLSTKASQTQDSASASETRAAASASDSTEKSAKKSESTKSTDKPSKPTATPSKTVSVPDDAQAGGVSLITPAATAKDEYYKIGDNVEFAWNYTSLLVPPNQINVLVSRKVQQATYTLANNVTFKPTGRVVWNTSQDEEGPNALLTETYTLVIHDAAEDVTAPAEPGHLVSFQDFTFGMYIPQPYTPWPDWKCATCSSALSDMERQTLKFVLGMCTITILSFTWFAGGFGALF